MTTLTPQLEDIAKRQIEELRTMPRKGIGEYYNNLCKYYKLLGVQYEVSGVLQQLYSIIEQRRGY